MSTSARASMVVTSWQESPYAEVGGVSLAQAESPATLSGDLEGISTTRTLLVYPSGAAPSFVGLQAFEGSVHGRPGTLLFQQAGTFVDDAAHVTLTVVPGSGTGALAGITGSGKYVARAGEQAIDVELDYQLG